MKNILLILMICFSGLTVMSQPTFTTAVEYNDYIVAQQTAVGDMIEQLTVNLGSDDSATVYANYAALQAQAGISLANIKLLDEFNGNSTFKSASILLFEFYIDIINNEYSRIIAILIKEKPSEEEYAVINTSLTSIIDKEIHIDEVFSSAQQQFADENGIDLIFDEEYYEESNDE